MVFDFSHKCTKTTKHSLKGEHDTFIIVRRHHKAANKVKKQGRFSQKTESFRPKAAMFYSQLVGLV